MTSIDTLNSILNDAAGVDADQLKRTNPADAVLRETAKNMAGHIDARRTAAERIKKNMDRVLDGFEPMGTLGSDSDTDTYDAACHAIAALRGPLAAAADAYKQAHSTD